MCYTFNNYPQAMNQYLNRLPDVEYNNGHDSKESNRDFFSSFLNFRPIETTPCSENINTMYPEIKKVTGCGKKSGLQLIIDSHKMLNLLPKDFRMQGYYVFITVPGVVTSKIPFYVNPDFDGEHNFYLHGIHNVGASETFKDWNEKHQVCYFQDGKNLTYFNYYNKDNCLMECKLKKISSECKCSPWYIPQESNNELKLNLCGRKGNLCFTERLENYRKEADDCLHCKDDCRMVHIFSTLQREPFSTNPAERDMLFNSLTSKGLLANYLLDPQRIFNDDITLNMTKFTYNLSSDKELAEERFRKDIAVLNFFFDTPIITLIQQELKTTVFDMISAIGGTLGLFTGISIISIAELTWWIWTIAAAAMKRASKTAKVAINSRNTKLSGEDLR